MDPQVKRKAQFSGARVVAQRTPGMTGADPADVVNEAALAAARRGSETVARRDFEQAVDRLQLGLEKRGGLLSPEEKRRVAWHEAGHTLAALSVEHADPVHRVTIIPRSIGALGATLQLPDQERTLMTRDQLLDRVCVLMGGRAAEELALGDTSTGAHNDLERASELARQMICRFGMSRDLGPVAYGRSGRARFLDLGDGEERNYSEKTAQAIDAEVRRLLTDEYERALTLLTRRHDALERIATWLLEVETLERTELERLAAGQAQGPADERRPAAA